MIGIQVFGTEQVSKRLAQIRIGVDGASAEGVRKTALSVVSHAKQLCPVDTGRLRSSIQVMDFNAREPSAVVGTNVEYAEFVEYGTSRQSAQPYMRPASVEGRKVLKAITESEIKKVI